MPGENILIVDDSPVNAKLVHLLLAHEGYQVQTAPSAEAALEVLQSFKPEIVLADIRLPGMDGLEMTRQIRRDSRHGDIAVIALTAFSQESDREEALAAGCNGYITKPIDTRTFPGHIREFLNRRKERSEQSPVDLASLGLAGPEFESLRREFLREGLAQCQALLASLDGMFDLKLISQHAHQWAGNGGLLGYPEISRFASQIDRAIREQFYDRAFLRESLTKLAQAFRDPDCKFSSMRERSVPEHIQGALAGKRIALVGFPGSEAEGICQTLESVGALTRLFEIADPPHLTAVQECELVVIHVCKATKGTAWLRPNPSPSPARATVFAGDRDQLLSLEPELHAHASEYIINTWQPEEFLLRLSFALSRLQVSHGSASPNRAETIQQTPGVAGDRRPSCARVLIADDDPIIERVVRVTLENHGMSCLVTRNGEDALRMIHMDPPQAAVLDVNMPGKDGYEVLEAIRAEKLPVSVVLLTARHQEKDIIRGFRLGADDYMTKPFNPVELVARLRRLLQ